MRDTHWSDELRGRRVFLTGHTGFKGAWLALWLHHLGARVTGYSLDAPTTPSVFELADVSAVLSEDHRADLCDRERLAAALTDARPDIVLHLAAQSAVRPSYRDPWTTFHSNVMGTAALLDAVRRLATPCAVIVVTTDKCYENHEHVWGYRESDAMGGYDPYSASKGAAELVVASYRRSFFHPDELGRHGVSLATARAGNVIGGGDFKTDAIVPDIARSQMAGLPPAIRSPASVRPWQHVLDCLSGYLLLGSRMLQRPDPRWCSAWNFGPLPGSELPVRDLVERFLGEWGSSTGWIDASDPSQPHEAHTLRLCVDKAVWTLGWRPRWSMEEAIIQTAAWYRRWHLEGASAAELCREQIDGWMALSEHRDGLLSTVGT